MRQIAYREALREAMNEEMRRDDRVFLMGEEVAEYNGAYKVSQGMLDEFGPKRVIDTPISDLGFTAVAVGADILRGGFWVRLLFFRKWTFRIIIRVLRFRADDLEGCVEITPIAFFVAGESNE